MKAACLRDWLTKGWRSKGCTNNPCMNLKCFLVLGECRLHSKYMMGKAQALRIFFYFGLFMLSVKSAISPAKESSQRIHWCKENLLRRVSVQGCWDLAVQALLRFKSGPLGPHNCWKSRCGVLWNKRQTKWRTAGLIEASVKLTALLTSVRADYEQQENDRVWVLRFSLDIIW